MLYVSDSEVKKNNYDWNLLLDKIEETTRILATGDFCQPIKPYVDFKNPSDRIIAMPAYVGGTVDVAGIKWIASFPDNINHDIPRANSVTVLNDAHTGIPFAFFNTTELSVVRTASVSGVILREYMKNITSKIKIGIVGFGPIGQMHYRMICDLFSDKVEEIKIYDLRDVSAHFNDSVKTVLVSSWNEAYKDVDVMITTTASKERYINTKPKEKCLLLNVSLRDYTDDVYDYVKKGIIVDNWEEVCRKNTDIEKFHLNMGLQKEETYTILDVIEDKVFGKINTDIYMFNPMGMSSYDIAIGKYFYDIIKENNGGLNLD